MLEITNANFEKEVLKSAKPVIVDFWASWCGPCRMVAPIFEKLSLSMSEAKFAKLNVDDNQEISMKYGISSIPCMIIFKNGKEAGRIIGALPEEALKTKIKQLL